MCMCLSAKGNSLVKRSWQPIPIAVDGCVPASKEELKGAPQYLVSTGTRESDQEGTVRGTQGEPKTQRRGLSWNLREENFKKEMALVKCRCEVQSLKAARTLVTRGHR